MRHLSQQLVATQEEERRKLSRELHDHVGQMLTALRLEVGRLERTRTPRPTARFSAREVRRRVQRRLVETMLRTVRDLALGLRPSMLDDLGLQPALEWHVRDFRRRYSLRVDLTVTGDLSDFPIICAPASIASSRKRSPIARAMRRPSTSISASIATAHRLEVVVADDGVGFDPAARPSGLGLLGIEERVRELHGTFTHAHQRPRQRHAR